MPNNDDDDEATISRAVNKHKSVVKNVSVDFRHWLALN